MNFQFSAHAIERMKARAITKEEVQKVILSFDTKQNQGIATTVFSKLFKKNNKLYLYRVFLNETKQPPVVITVYKTTKIEKYGY